VVVSDSADEVTYQAGYRRALELAAERVDELDAIWVPVQRPSYEERVASRVADMERAAAEVHAISGTRPFGGLDNGAVLPGVDW